MNEYAVGRASADLRDAILKCMGLSAPIRLHGPKRRAKPKVKRPPPPRTSYIVCRPKEVEKIMALVAETNGLTIDQLTGRRGPAKVSDARQMAMYLAREIANQSYPHIGWMFKRDHTTVLHACREAIRRTEEEPDYAEKIQWFCDELDNLSPTFTSPKLGDRIPSDAYTARWNTARTDAA